MNRLLLIALLILGACESPKTLPPELPESSLLVIPYDEEGRRAHEVYLKAIQEAQHTISLVMYTFSDPLLIDALIDARNRGVDVRVIKEKKVFAHENNRGSLAKQEEGLEKMRAAGILIHGQPQRLLEKDPGSQAHQKVLIIDNSYAFLMTGNWSQKTLSQGRDFAVAITPKTDPQALAEIIRVFEADWDNRPVEVSCPSLVWGPDYQRSQLRELLESAKESIWIYQQIYTDPAFAQLLQLKAKKDLDVRLISMPYPFGGKSDDNAPFEDALLKAGGNVRLNLNYYMHAKVIIVDGKRAYIGSCNFYSPSIDSNRELGWVTENVSVLDELKKVFLTDWQTAVSFEEGKDVKKDWG